MRPGQPSQSQSVLKKLVPLLLGLSCILLSGCEYWFQDMKGFLEHWTSSVGIGEVTWSASPASQKDSSGVDTVSSNATITASVGIINPDGYPLDGGIGPDSDTLRSVRISGAAGTAALARASVTSSSSTGMEIEIAPLSMVPTPESLGLEHTNFTVELAPTRSENGLQSSTTHSLTLRYNTPPRMPLEVVYNKDTSKLDWMGATQWQVVQGAHDSALDDLIFWGWPSGISDPTHPDAVVKFEVYEDGVLFDEYTPDECLMSGQTSLQPFVPQDLKDAGYNIYCSLATTGTEITIYAVDSEGVRSQATTSGRAPHAITLNANGGSFGSSDTMTVYRAAGSSLTGGDLDIPTRDGHYLSGWTVGGAPVAFPYTVSAPATLTAQWTVNPSSGGGGSDGGTSGGGDSDDGSGVIVAPSTYTVTFNAAGGNFADGSSVLTKSVQSNTSVLQPASPTRTGWVFTWWKDSSTGSAYNFSKPVTSNLTLEANWTQEFYVNPTGGDDTNPGTQALPLKTIQAAVDKINGLNDESSAYTILLMGSVDDATTGSYTDNNKALVSIDPGTSGYTHKKLNLTIKSDADGIQRTINAGRDDANTGRVMYVGGSNTTVTLKDLAVTGGYSDDDGGGIYIESGIVKITSSTIASNKAANNGGGICCGGTLALDGTTGVTDNTAQNGGGGIFIEQNGTVTIVAGGNVTISQNTAENGGGVTVASSSSSSGSLVLESGSINGNTANVNGGGVHVNGGNFSMIGGSVSGNTATSSGGGIHVDSGGQTGAVVISGGSVGVDGSPNRAENGGGISADGGMVDLSGGAVSYNEATASGGGVYVNSTGDVTVSDGSISHNSAATSGGGVYLLSGKLDMGGGSVSSNQAVSGGGAYVAATATITLLVSSQGAGPSISGNSTSGKGGGIYLEGSLDMSGGEILGNTASSGAGIYTVAATQSFDLGGSACISPDNSVFLFGKTITVTSSLTATSPVATIEPNTYGTTTQVLAAGNTVTLANEVAKFAVVTDTVTSIPYFVEVNPADSSQGVLSKGVSVTGATAAAEIAKLSGSETYTVRITGELTEEQITGTDGIKAKLVELVGSSPDTKVVLDLSDINMSALPENAFYDPGTPLMGITGTPLDNVVGVVLPGTLQEIGSWAFSGCSQLATIEIPSSVTVLGAYCFSETGLTEIAIPNSVTQVGNGALRGCTNLKTVNFSSAMDTIPNAMFSNSGLETMTIPATITTIMNQAFQNCASLNSIVFADPTSTWTVTENAPPNATVNDVSVADAGNNAILLRTTYYLYDWTKNN